MNVCLTTECVIIFFVQLPFHQHFWCNSAHEQMRQQCERRIWPLALMKKKGFDALSVLSWYRLRAMASLRMHFDISSRYEVPYTSLLEFFSLLVNLRKPVSESICCDRSKIYQTSYGYSLSLSSSTSPLSPLLTVLTNCHREHRIERIKGKSSDNIYFTLPRALHSRVQKHS